MSGVLYFPPTQACSTLPLHTSTFNIHTSTFNIHTSTFNIHIPTTTTTTTKGISPVDPESRKLYEILTGRAYAGDHKMRDWLARSLAVEDASVEVQTPTFTPVEEVYTSDEEEERKVCGAFGCFCVFLCVFVCFCGYESCQCPPTHMCIHTHTHVCTHSHVCTHTHTCIPPPHTQGYRERSLFEMSFSKGFVGATLITAVMLVWESSNRVIYQPIKARIVPPDRSREIADVIYVTVFLLGVIKLLKE